MFKPLLTGATGLLGQHFIELLNENRIPHYSLGRNEVAKSPFTEHIYYDAADTAMEIVLPTDATDIYHLAQARDFRDFPLSDTNIFNVNIGYTQKLLTLARELKINNFVYTSTGGVYQQFGELLDENSPLINQMSSSYYPVSKLVSEYLVSSYQNYFNTIILRPFFLYGKGQDLNMLIPRLIRSVKNEVPIHLDGQEGISLNPLSAKDAAAALLSCKKVDRAEIINLSGDQIYSLKKIGDIIGEALNKEPLYQWTEKIGNDIIASNTKMKNLLSKPNTQLGELLHDL